MAYCALSDLYAVVDQSVIIQLTDDTNAGAVNSTNASAAIKRAADLIDGYVGAVAGLPLATSPAILTALNADLAVCELYARTGVDIPKAWQAKQTRAMQILRDISTGTVALVPDQEAGAGPSVIQVSARTKVFSTTNLDQY